MIAIALILIALAIPLAFAGWALFLFKRRKRPAFWCFFSGCVLIIVLISALRLVQIGATWHRVQREGIPPSALPAEQGDLEDQGGVGGDQPGDAP